MERKQSYLQYESYKIVFVTLSVNNFENDHYQFIFSGLQTNWCEMVRIKEICISDG